MQFRLRSLFSLTAAVAVSLGLWRILGGRWGLALIGIELLAAFLWRPRWFYCWFLPLFHATIAWNNFYYPGDEYAGFFFGGAFEGLWVIALIGDSGSVARSAVVVVAAGCATIAVPGWLLDRLRAPFIPWALLLVLSASGLVASYLNAFPTIERALARNGSYEAYILPAINGGLVLATLAVVVGTGFCRALQRWKQRGATA